VSYVYVAEVSGASVRGTLSAVGPVLVSFGVLLVYALGATVPWRLVALVAALVALGTGLLGLALPESPPWLLARGKKEEARAALNWLGHCPETAAAELRQPHDKFSFKKYTNF